MGPLIYRVFVYIWVHLFTVSYLLCVCIYMGPLIYCVLFTVCLYIYGSTYLLCVGMSVTAPQDAHKLISAAGC